MKILGLTGGIASGKSTVARILEDDHALPIIDADRLSKAAVVKGSTGLRLIVQHFGEDYLLKNGEMDRQKMGALIRRDEKARQALNAIVHPLVNEGFCTEKETLGHKGHDLVVYDCPLLFEENLQYRVDLSLLVVTEKELRASRLMKRDSISETIAYEKMAIQMSDDQKEQMADIVLYNNGDLEDLKNAVAQLVADLKKKLQKIL